MHTTRFERWRRLTFPGDAWAAVAFLGPFLLFFIVFKLVPLAGGVILSFTDSSLLKPISYAGIDNYVRMFSDPIFLRSLTNTFKYMAGILPLIAIAFLAALALRSVRIGRNAFMAIIFAPYVIAMPVHAFVFNFIYQPETGALSALLRRLGAVELSYVGWLQDPSTALYALMAVWVYVYLGYMATLFYTGLQDIPSTYYDAARIDGAGWWRTVKNITLPLLSNVMLYALVTGVIFAFQVFPLVWIMTGGGLGLGAGGPAYSTISLDLYVYQSAFRDHMLGYGSAMGVLMLIVTLIVTSVPFRLLPSVSYD